MNMIPQQLVDNPDLLLDKGFEWVDGQVVEKPMGARASVIGAELTGLLNRHVRANSLGHVLNSEGPYELSLQKRRQVRKPDVSFVARGRLPGEVVPDGNMKLAPDLAAEVVSPNDLAEDLARRAGEFLEAGTRLVWLIFPAARLVWVLRKDGSGAHLTESQELSGEDVVPGFTCPVASLFAGL